MKYVYAARRWAYQTSNSLDSYSWAIVGGAVCFVAGMASSMALVLRLTP